MVGPCIQLTSLAQWTKLQVKGQDVTSVPELQQPKGAPQQNTQRIQKYNTRQGTASAPVTSLLLAALDQWHIRHNPSHVHAVCVYAAEGLLLSGRFQRHQAELRCQPLFKHGVFPVAPCSSSISFPDIPQDMRAMWPGRHGHGPRF